MFPIALGCMGMGAGSPYGKGDEAESIATVHAAIDRGVSLLDTGDFYGMGSSEMLVGHALNRRVPSHPARLLLAGDRDERAVAGRRHRASAMVQGERAGLS